MSRILITGACGTVGEALLDALVSKENIVCAFDNNEDGLFKIRQKYKTHEFYSNMRFFLGDVRDLKRLNKAFEDVDVVYHCAALKHVFICESNPFEAIQTNINGVENVISAALLNNISKLIFTSSDKAVNPSSSMGATKLIGERLITSASMHSGNHKTKFCSVRFGNILNSNGSVLKIFDSQIKSNQSLTITSKEMTRYFITLDDAVNICRFAEKNMLGGEIFISNMGAANIMSLVNSVAKGKKYTIKEIGLIPGEKKYEELNTDAELSRTKKINDNYFAVIPEIEFMESLTWKDQMIKNYHKLEGLTKVMRSDIDLLTQANVDKLVKKSGFFKS